eukprot:CAMPEP_0176375390 /NCGR_PEP_ID=MMETSP0126-20121128/27478_1 /TAXON_ID=141414 ORGANISM="Strombidinopsis acuminatum, Strain SPMC142" /NCGR_SAMPLE_ID=MMETSP0126 /ASSEMBLY_ACC=CAM_ASM_000229 /LENGTH=80 /DNA_ID=CAMNT_0017736455 /DNA_START=134 /DNA_END=376 /DNA_ORIENTATION=-
MDAEYKQNKATLDAKFFKEADKNEDGVLDAEEWENYNNLQMEFLSTKLGGKPPVNADLMASGFEAYQITGKNGITMDDIR